MCHARYIVQIGLFALGGRTVRCTRCKHEWHASLPHTIDVVGPLADQPPPAYPPPPIAAVPDEGGAASAHKPAIRAAIPNLPAVIKRFRWQRKFAIITAAVAALLAVLSLPIIERQAIVTANPDLRGFYASIGLAIPQAGVGLVFNNVTSELKYDSGTMRLYVDGVIHNSTEEMQFIPDIKARALGPDQGIIQSWMVDAPAMTIAAGADVPFHTEVAAPMQRTIEDVSLEFFAQDEKANVSQ